MPTPSPERQLSEFIAKFEPDMGRLIREARAKVRRFMPKAFELVYDNYNFFVIGFGPSEKTGEAIISLAAQAKGLSLFFLQGAKLPDPHRLLQGSGKVVRSIRLKSADELDDPKIRQLINAALTLAKTPIGANGRHTLIIKSVSNKQRPRKPAR